MIASSPAPRRGVPLAALLCALASAAAAAASPAAAQQLTQPGNLVIERTITPRDAFVPVPKNQDPIAVQAETFPRATFNGAIASMATDLDLNGAHGSGGIAGSGVRSTLASVGGMGQVLGATGNSVPVGANATAGAGLAGLGSSISQTVTSALAPLGAALGATK
jgi:hypothetical protein